MKKMLFLLGIIFVLASCTHNYISTEEWQNEATQTPITTFTQVITASPSATVIDNSSECLPPIKDFEYTLDVEPPTEAIPLIDKVLPSSSKWQMVLDLPDYSSLELVQTINNRTIFWIYTGGRQFVRYQVYGNDWENGDLY
ncbi:MAG: membrane lipoprotein lipid attachment site-containing protein [Anaerolineaceae bacterium]